MLEGVLSTYLIFTCKVNTVASVLKMRKLRHRLRNLLVSPAYSVVDQKVESRHLAPQSVLLTLCQASYSSGHDTLLSFLSLTGFFGGLRISQLSLAYVLLRYCAR